MRLCLSPALVSLLSLSFHLADGLICFVVFCLFVFCGLVCFVWFALVADRILPISRNSFRDHSSPAIRSWGNIVCLAVVPHRPVFHLSCADFVSFVSPVSLAAKGLLGCGVSGVFWFCWGFVVWFVCSLVFGFFVS